MCIDSTPYKTNEIHKTHMIIPENTEKALTKSNIPSR